MKGRYWTTVQRQELEARWSGSDDVGLFRRVLALLELDRGRSVTQIAKELRVNRRTIHRWIERFSAKGNLDALKNQPLSGRPRKWNKESHDLLESALAQPPMEIGYPARSICRGRRFPAPVCVGGSRSWATCGKRFRYVLPPDPQPEKKLDILATIRALPARTVLFAQDETDLLLFPPLRSGWALRGKPSKVLISGQNARRTIFGALHLRTDRMLCLEQRHKRAEEFQQLLEFIHWHYRGGPVTMLLDENSTHTSEESKSLADDLAIQLLWLPRRSHHLNPLDQLWGHGKRAVCANLQQGTIEDQVDYFLGYYDDLSGYEHLVKAGMFSLDFWLYRV